MIRPTLAVLIFILSCLPCLAADIPPVEVMGLLGSRELVGSVSFAKGEDHLGNEAVDSIDRIVSQLSKETKHPKLVRVEGYSAVGETAGSSIDLSLARAKAVEVYLRETRKVKREIFLIGYANQSGSPRVEVAVYDMLLPINDAPVDSIINKW